MILFTIIRLLCNIIEMWFSSFLFTYIHGINFICYANHFLGNSFVVSFCQEYSEIRNPRRKDEGIYYLAKKTVVIQSQDIMSCFDPEQNILPHINDVVTGLA